MKKYLIYTRYIVRHKWFVAMALFGVPLSLLFSRKDPFRILVVVWRLLVHDLSKFSPDEFFPYAEFFYGVGSVEQKGMTIMRRELSEAQEAFDVAWLKHQHRNPHHWQHWVLPQDDGRTKTIKMPMSYLVEMLCDWAGASRAIRGKNADVRDWYVKNYMNIKLNAVTCGFVGQYMRYK